MRFGKHAFWSLWFPKYLAIMLNFFSKCSNFNVNSKIAIKKQQNVFGFLDNCIWIGNGKFFLLCQGYSYSAINVLTRLEFLNINKIRDICKIGERFGSFVCTGKKLFIYRKSQRCWFLNHSFRKEADTMWKSRPIVFQSLFVLVCLKTYLRVWASHNCKQVKSQVKVNNLLN